MEERGGSAGPRSGGVTAGVGTTTGHYPTQVAIEAYGRGGFRFAGASHRGSLLALPSGLWAWEVADAGELTPDRFARLWAEPGRPAVVLLGTGARFVVPSAEVRAVFAAAGIGLECMTTGAACRTYNVLLAEARSVAAALVVVP